MVRQPSSGPNAFAIIIIPAVLLLISLSVYLVFQGLKKREIKNMKDNQNYEMDILEIPNLKTKTVVGIPDFKSISPESIILNETQPNGIPNLKLDKNPRTQQFNALKQLKPSSFHILRHLTLNSIARSNTYA